MSRKMKQIMLAVILMVMMCAVSPARKVSAEVLNSPQQIVWGQSYSGELEDAQNTYEYTFTMKKSGTFSLAIATEEIGKTHTGLNYIKVSDMYDNEIYTASVSEGNGSYKAELLAGDYKLSLCAGFYTGCKFTFTASYKASGETRSEVWLSQNDEKTMAFTYKAGTTYKGQFAFNETTDIYKMKMTKNRYMNIQINSKIKEMNVVIENTNGDIHYIQMGVTPGTRKYTFFLPKGTYYITMTKGWTYSVDPNYAGMYTFKTTFTDVPKTTVNKVKNLSSGKLKVTWKCKSKATGYQIQIATDKKFKKNKKVYDAPFKNYNNCTFWDLKKGKTYYVRVRSYVKAGSREKKCYSAWSKYKTVKIKK